MDIILASSSPRRQELLKYVFKYFSAFDPNVDETAPRDLDPIDVPAFLAAKKARHYAEDYPRALIIGCDTVVNFHGEIIGKPKDTDDAKFILNKLSGNTHTVITACCLCHRGIEYPFVEETEVEFYPLTQREIDDYVATREPFDKAGAYAIQGDGMMFVKRISGDYNNVVGLPAARLKREVASFMSIF